MYLSENIYKLRCRHKMSQEDLAEALGVSRQSVSKWENGNAVPDLDRLVKLSELFGVSLDQLVNGNENPRAAESLPEPTVIIHTEHSSTQKTVGIMLLFFGILIFLMTFWSSQLSGVISCLLLSAPVLICSLICLRAKRHPWLLCLLTIYYYLWLPMGIFSPSFINYNGARVAQLLHIFWGVWLISGGLLLNKKLTIFEGKAVLAYYVPLALTVLLSALIFLFPGLLPTPGLMRF